MGITGLSRALLIAWMLWFPAAGMAQAADFRIVHAEPITLRNAAAASTAALKARPWEVNLQFTAYGKQFNLQLQSNDRLLANLPARQRENLIGYRLYRGHLANLPDSWVRLTRTPSGDYGAVWDGKDLFTIAPASTVNRALSTVIASHPADSLIYRSSDTNSAAGQAYCSVVEPASGTTNSSPVGMSYKALVEELQMSLAATDLRGQIEIALVGDNEFVSSHQPDPQGAMLARLNLVDEIFSEQVGIAVVATELQAIAGATDPFTTTAPSTLLEQFSAYRDTTPAVRSRGLAHLLTGRDLDGNTAGIAYRASLCDPRFGASLSESRGGDVTSSALIMAHEIGHNFGAPHDGAAGACGSTPQNFLMAPILNGSSQFSACSISEMAAEIAAASCIAPATSFADVSITNSPGSTQGVVDEPFPLTLIVTGTGTLPDGNVQIQTTVPSNFVLVQNLTPAYPCSLISTVLTCQVGTVLPGESRQIDLQLRSFQVGSFNGSLVVTSSRDRYAANNTQNISYTVADTTDGSIGFSVSQYSVATRIPADFDLIVRTRGNESLVNSGATINLSGMTIETVNSAVGTCTISGSSANCSLGTLPPNSSFMIRVRARTATAGSGAASAVFRADNERILWNNVAFVPLNAVATVDVALATQPTVGPILLGTSFNTTVSLNSTGTQAVNNLAVRVNESPWLALESVVPSQGSCVRDSLGYLCQIGSVAAGQSRTLQIRARGIEIAESIPLITQVEDNGVDDQPDNNSTYTTVSIRRNRDIAVEGPSYSRGYDASPFTATIPLSSIGMSAVPNVTVTVTLPASVTIQAASLAGASCQASGNTATCTAASIAAGFQGHVAVTLVSTQMGLHSGAVTVTSLNDGYAGNNSANLNVEIIPFIDTAIEQLSPPTTLTTGEVFSLRYRILQNRNPANDFWFFAQWGTWVELVSYEGPFTSCFRYGDIAFRCDGIPLAANSTTFVTLNLRAQRRMNVEVRAASGSQADPVYANNEVNFAAFADRQGDAALASSGATSSARSGESFSAPAFSVTASRPIDEATIEIEIGNETVAALESVSIGGGLYCQVFTSKRALCGIGTLEAGESREMVPRFRAAGPGTTTATYKLLSPNDIGAANNTATLSISVTGNGTVPSPSPSPTPTPSPASPSASGGGGGGAFDLGALLALLCLAMTRQTRLATVRRRRK